MLKFKERPTDTSEFDWRADEQYRRAGAKLAEIRVSETRLQGDLTEAHEQIAARQAEVDRLQLAVLAGQASDAQVKRATAELQDAMRGRDAIAAELDHMRRLLPGLDAIEREIAHKTRQPYAAKLKVEYQAAVEALGKALREAAQANRRVMELHQLSTLEFEGKDLAVHHTVSGLPDAAWNELNLADPNGRLATWLNEHRGYGFEV